MAINWKNIITKKETRKELKNEKKKKNRNRKGHIFSSFCLFAIIILLILSQIAVSINFQDSTIMDMVNDKYRADQKYVDTYVTLFHSLVRDSLYQQGYLFTDGESLEKAKNVAEASKTQKEVLVYSACGQDYNVCFKAQYGSDVNKKSILAGTRIGTLIYNNANAFTNDFISQTKLMKGTVNGSAYDFVLYTNSKGTLYDIDITDDAEINDEWIYETTENLNPVTLTVLSQYAEVNTSNNDLQNQFHYKITDEDNKYSADLGIYGGNELTDNSSITAETLAYSTIAWQSVLNLMYAPCEVETEIVPLLYFSGNSQLGKQLLGNDVYVKRYEELYGEEEVYFVSDEQKDKNINYYQNYNLLEQEDKDLEVSFRLVDVSNLLKTTNSVIGLFVNKNTLLTNPDTLVCSMEKTAANVRGALLLMCILGILGILLFLAECYALRKNIVLSMDRIPRKNIPVEIRILLLLVLIITSYFLFCLGTGETLKGLRFCMVAFISGSYLIYFGFLFIKDRKIILQNSLLAKWSQKIVDCLIAKQGLAEITGIAYNIYRKSAQFIMIEGLLLLFALIDCAVCYMISEYWNYYMEQFGTEKGENIKIIAFLSGILIVLLMAVAIIDFGHFIRQYVKGISGIQKQLELMGKGDFQTIVELPDDFYGFHAEKQFEIIKEGVLASVENEMKSERMKMELIANVSHDIKTPLTSIINYVDLLADMKELPPLALDYIKVLQRKSYRLKTMIQDLFDLSKATSGNLPIQIVELDFSKLIQQTVADMTEIIEQSDLDIRIQLSEDVKIMADSNRLYRVIQNLIQNALKYSLEHSRVYLNLEILGENAVFTIKNVSKMEMNFTKEQVMERFFRGDKSRSTEGSGLGVAIANSFTQACGGTFDIEINADLFTATITFPTLL